MPIICTTCGHSRKPQDTGPAAICPQCQMPYTAAAIKARTPDPESPPQQTAPVKVAWPTAVNVTVVDFDISFFSLVWLLFKAAFAAIPAALLIGFAWFIFYAFTRGLLH